MANLYIFLNMNYVQLKEKNLTRMNFVLNNIKIALDSFWDAQGYYNQMATWMTFIKVD